MKEKHLFLANSSTFDISFDDTFGAVRLLLKQETRVEKSIRTGLICLSNYNYVFIQKDPTLPIISAPIDSGYLGDCTLIVSRPITLPKGYTFHMYMLEKVNTSPKLPDDMKIRKPAYKGDIGRDAYLKKSAKNYRDIQFTLQNSKGTLFFPRSSAAKKGYEVSVTIDSTKIRANDLSLIYKEDAYSVVQCVSGMVSKITGEHEFMDKETAENLLDKLKSKSHRGDKKEGSSDSVRV